MVFILESMVMAEPFKNNFNNELIENMARHFVKAWSKFDHDGFIKDAQTNLASLELKERSTQITLALTNHLPKSFEKAGEVMLLSLAPVKQEPESAIWETGQGGIAGWAIMPLTAYVAQHGLKHFDLSMGLLKEMTKRSSAEFDIRFFLESEPERTLSVLEKWSKDPNQHVRRLVSEGTRPRLPWGIRLHGFVANPKPVIRLLEMLKDDSEEYVRRSVANNLNDIAKDHPDLVAEIAGRWLKGANKNRQRLVRHACRTLIKQGHQATLKALGFSEPEIQFSSFKILKPKVIFGNSLEFEVKLNSTSSSDQPIIIDYAIHHMKASGKLTPKVFKWKTTTLKADASIEATKKHPMRKITTRVYYAGSHRLEIIINGVSFGILDFELII